MVKLAIKNSLIQTKNQVVELDEIEEVMTFYPSSEEFVHLIDYIEKLHKEGASKYGCIKIIPPKEFRPPLAFDQFSNERLPARYQVLQELSQGRVRN